MKNCCSAFIIKSTTKLFQKAKNLSLSRKESVYRVCRRLYKYWEVSFSTALWPSALVSIGRFNIVELFLFPVWCYALVHQLITLQNFDAHLRRVPAECSNASYCESSANKTSCMSSWCALLPESHRLCGKLFIFPAVSSLRTSVQLL